MLKYCANFNDKVARLIYFNDAKIYVDTKVECWLKLGA